MLPPIPSRIRPAARLWLPRPLGAAGAGWAYEWTIFALTALVVFGAVTCTGVAFA